MDKKEFIKALMLWTAILAAIVILIIGLCFGKLIEPTLELEIAKWIVMGLVIIGILEAFIGMGVGGILYHFWHKKK